MNDKDRLREEFMLNLAKSVGSNVSYESEGYEAVENCFPMIHDFLDRQLQQAKKEVLEELLKNIPISGVGNKRDPHQSGWLSGVCKARECIRETIASLTQKNK